MRTPSKKTLVCTTSFDNQQDSTLAGEFHLLDVPPSPHGFPQIEVTFAIDENGLLYVSAVDMSSRRRKHTHVEESGCLSKRKMEQMMNESEKLEQKNEQQRSKITARGVLENYIFTVKSEMEKDEIKQRIREKSRKRILTMCEKTLKWIEFDKKATKKDYKHMLKKVEIVCRPVIAVKKHGSQAQESQRQNAKLTSWMISLSADSGKHEVTKHGN
ncbi:Heat shock cognate 70 kDa protein [Taenia solium]